MIKVIAFVTKRAGISRDEFVKRWTEDHIELSRVLGASPYRINIAAEPQDDGAKPPYDGTAEMYWPDLPSFRAALASPAGALAGADVGRFASKVELAVYEEWVVR